MIKLYGLSDKINSVSFPYYVGFYKTGFNLFDSEFINLFNEPKTLFQIIRIILTAYFR